MIGPLDEITFLLQVARDSERVLMCSPDDQLVCEVATAGAPNITVKVNPWLRKGTVYVVDANALEAMWRQNVQRLRP